MSTIQFTTASFNLRNMRAADGRNSWPHRRGLVARMLAELDADIVGTQEGYWPQIKHISSDVAGYDFVAAGRDDGFQAGETCAIFYRRSRCHLQTCGTFWFSETPDEPGSRHWTPRHARICTWATFAVDDTFLLRVLNVHLDHETQPAREKSIELLMQKIRTFDNDNAVILMGDFNMTPHNPAFIPLSKAASKVMLKDVHFGRVIEGKDGTFHNFTGRDDMERIDYIFVSSHLKPLRSTIVLTSYQGHYPSDHYPILAELTI